MERLAVALTLACSLTTLGAEAPWRTGILRMMDENHVDFYREDHNRDPGPVWTEGDRLAEAKMKSSLPLRIRRK